MNTDGIQIRWEWKVPAPCKCSRLPKVASYARATRLHLNLAAVLVAARLKHLQADPPSFQFCLAKLRGTAERIIAERKLNIAVPRTQIRWEWEVEK